MKKNTFARSFFFSLVVLLILAFTVQPAAQASVNPNAVDPNLPYALYSPVMYFSQPPTWLNGPYGGSIVTLAADPSNASIVYAGTAGAGVWKSTSAGDSWTAANKGISTFAINILVIDPTHPLTIYAGTHGNGIYRSIDGGATWTPGNQGIIAGSTVFALAINSGNTALLYAGTRKPNSSDGVLYKSTDYGVSWTAVFSQTGDWVYSLAVNPAKPNIIVAATNQHKLYIAESYGSSGEWHTVASISGGVSWDGRAVTFGKKSTTSSDYYGYYAAKNNDVYRSSDGGQNWSLSDSGVGTSVFNPNSISVKPQNPAVIYLGTYSGDQGGVLRSSNYGSNWSGVGLSNRRIYTVAAPIGGGNTVFAGAYMEGFYKNYHASSSTSWVRSVTGLVNSQVTGVVFPDSSNSGIIYASTLGGGVSKSTDGGNTWTDFNTGLPELIINGLLQYPSNPQILYALTNAHGLYAVNISSSSTWSSTSTWTPNASAPRSIENGQPLRNPFVRPELADEASPEEAGIFLDSPQPDVTEDGAPAEAEVSISAFNFGINDMAFYKADPHYAWAATNGNGVYFSGDSGTNWNQRGLDNTTVKKIAVSPTDPNLVYVVATRSVNGTNKDIVMKTTDGGTNWYSMLLPDSSLTVYTVQLWPGVADLPVAGTSNGVYVYNGTTWVAAGLQGNAVTSFSLSSYFSNTMFATTYTGAYASIDYQYWIAIGETGIHVQSINFNPANPPLVYIGTMDRGIERATYHP